MPIMRLAWEYRDIGKRRQTLADIDRPGGEIILAEDMDTNTVAGFPSPHALFWRTRFRDQQLPSRASSLTSPFGLFGQSRLLFDGNFARTYWNARLPRINL
jgi:hypothetical protein